MKVARGVRLSLRALAANRLRAGLVCGAIALGVTSLVVTGALAAGAEREVARSLATLGTNLLVVRPTAVPRAVNRREIAGRVTTLSPGDAAAIAALPGVAAAAPGADGAVRAKVGRTAVAANAMGTTPAFLGIRGFRLASGRFLDDTDQREARRVAVLGARIADTLFPDGGAVGREVRLRGVPFEVIGTLAAKGAALGGGDEDTVIVMPMTTALRRVFNRPWLSAVFVSAADPASMDRTGVAVGRLVRVRHRPARDGRDDFEVQNTARLLTLQRQTLDLLGWLTAGLAVLTLAGGGSSVLAVMWLSVSDRTGEIGLRRAVGATDTAIVGQFLAEATALAVAGWLAGLAAAGVAIAAAANATRWSIGLPADALALSAAMVAIAALVPGAVAAIRAARIAPVEALRKA